jgi:hypothetical protein
MQKSILGTIAFNPYAAGNKVYSQVSGAPNIGPSDKAGYAERDKIRAAKKSALLAKMKAVNVGAYADPNVLRSTR